MNPNTPPVPPAPPVAPTPPIDPRTNAPVAKAATVAPAPTGPPCPKCDATQSADVKVSADPCVHSPHVPMFGTADGKIVHVGSTTVYKPVLPTDPAIAIIPTDTNRHNICINCRRFIVLEHGNWVPDAFAEQETPLKKAWIGLRKRCAACGNIFEPALAPVK